MAMDRTNEAVSYLYAPLHLGVLRILKRIVEEAKSLSRPLEICGEMSADPRFVYVLLGLGIREFSMLPSAIPRMIEFLEKAEFSRAEELTKKLFSLSSAEEREDLLHQEMEKQGLLRKAQD
jgi:phosphotransferase system enzyme I (PtsI)